MQSADSMSSSINQMESSMKDSGLCNVPSSQSKSMMDGNPPFRSILEGYDSNEDDDDPKKMLAHLDQATAAVSTHGETDSKAALAGKNQAEPVTSNDLFAGAKDMLVDMPANLGQAAAHSPRGSNDEEEIDPAQTLADFQRTSSAAQNASNREAEVFDPTQLLAEIQNCLSALRSTVGQVSDDDSNDPKAMLAAIEVRAPVIDRNDQSTLLGDVEPMSLQAQDDSSDDIYAELEALHRKLTKPTASVSDSAPIATEIQLAQSPNDGLDEAIIPYVIALQLEKTGLPWEQLRSWTTYLFSSGHDGHEACRRKEKIMKEAEDELNAIIKQALGDESSYLEAENLARLPYRLVVSNIAAGADEDDLKEFFWPLRYQIQGLKMLPERDPIKRTKIAHVDMYGRETAIRASYLTGNIFGLLLDIKLVVEKVD